MDKILIIQDSPSINMVLKFRLESEGFFVETSETGENGIKKAKEARYQLILLDYNLPGIDGLEVCRVLREEENTKNVPIVFITAKDEDEISRSIKDAGATGYIGMPFEGKKFIESIKRFIEK